MSLLRENTLRAAMANFDSSTSLASSDMNAVYEVLQPYGSRLLPQVVKDLSRSYPTRVYATFPLSSDLSPVLAISQRLKLRRLLTNLPGGSR